MTKDRAIEILSIYLWEAEANESYWREYDPEMLPGQVEETEALRMAIRALGGGDNAI